MVRRDVYRAKRADFAIKHIDLQPHLGRDQCSEHPRILSPGADEGLHRCGITRVQQIEFSDAALGRFGVLLVELGQVAVDARDRQPVAGVVGVAGEGVGHVEDACQILDPLHIARQPQRGLGMPGDQVDLMGLGKRVHQASTHVSLVPPRLARNSPPTSRPAARRGSARRAAPRCPCRSPRTAADRCGAAARRPSHRVGETDSFSVGWLM